MRMKMKMMVKGRIVVGNESAFRSMWCFDCWS